MTNAWRVQVVVTRIYTNTACVFVGEPEQVRARLRAAYPWLPGRGCTWLSLSDLVELLDAQQPHSAQLRIIAKEGGSA